MLRNKNTFSAKLFPFYLPITFTNCFKSKILITMTQARSALISSILIQDLHNSISEILK